LNSWQLDERLGGFRRPPPVEWWPKVAVGWALPTTCVAWWRGGAAAYGSPVRSASGAKSQGAVTPLDNNIPRNFRNGRRPPTAGSSTRAAGTRGRASAGEWFAQRSQILPKLNTLPVVHRQQLHGRAADRRATGDHRPLPSETICPLLAAWMIQGHKPPALGIKTGDVWALVKIAEATGQRAGGTAGSSSSACLGGGWSRASGDTRARWPMCAPGESGDNRRGLWAGACLPPRSLPCHNTAGQASSGARALSITALYAAGSGLWPATRRSRRWRADSRRTPPVPRR
jgi:hypothetical protein